MVQRIKGRPRLRHRPFNREDRLVTLPMTSLLFHVEHPGEVKAGIHPFTEDVTISFKDTDIYEVEDSDDYLETFVSAVKEYFDGAGVMFHGSTVRHGRFFDRKCSYCKRPK